MVKMHLTDASMLITRSRKTGRECQEWKDDFVSGGHVKASRQPGGKTPVALCHGILWFYLLGNHILIGENLKPYLPWFIGPDRISSVEDIRIGWVVGKYIPTIGILEFANELSFSIALFLYSAVEGLLDRAVVPSPGKMTAPTILRCVVLDEST